MSLRGFSSENRGRTFSKDQSQRHDTSAPAFATLVRPSHAQAPAVLDHSRTLPQGDGGAGPAFAGGAEGSERDLIVLDASDVLHDAFAVRGPRIDAEGEVSSECAHVAPKICLVHWGILPPRKNCSALGSVAFFPGASCFGVICSNPPPPRASPPVPPTPLKMIERLAIVSTGRNRLFQVPAPP